MPRVVSMVFSMPDDSIHYKDGVLFVEASTLGLVPGNFPVEMQVDGQRFVFFQVLKQEDAVEYRTAQDVRLLIIND